MTTQYLLIAHQQTSSIVVGIYESCDRALLALHDVLSTLKGFEEFLDQYMAKYNTTFNMKQAHDDGFIYGYFTYEIKEITIAGPQDLAYALDHRTWTRWVGVDWEAENILRTIRQLLHNLAYDLNKIHKISYGLIATQDELSKLTILHK